MNEYSQDIFDFRFEWGAHGIDKVGAISDVIIIVDILSFATAVDVAVSRGAIVYPYVWKDLSSSEFAAKIGAKLAVSRKKVNAENPFSLSPMSYFHVREGDKIVLPSLNGSTLAIAASNICSNVLIGCLRNAQAVAEKASRLGKTVSVIAAGERWKRGDETGLRFALEDLIGAGAILNYLKDGSFSPEAKAAIAVFKTFENNLEEILLACESGRELVDAGYRDDVIIASKLDESHIAPQLIDGAIFST
jgi:2-phosphosulfolactate phosphatase